MVIQQYQDPSVSKWLKIGYWYEEHKQIIFKTIIGLLIAINVGFWGNTFFNIYKVINSSKHEDYLYSELTKNRIPVQDLHTALAPDDLIISSISAAPSATSKSSFASSAELVDLVAIARNPNQNWIMEVEYYFYSGTEETQTRSVQILPEQEMPLIMLGIKGPVQAQTQAIQTQIKWQRQKDKKAITRAISAKQSIIATKVQINPRQGVTDIEITLENKGAYNIAESDIVIILTNFSGASAGIGVYKAEQISIDEPLVMQMRWQHALQAGLSAQIYPLADFLNDSIYTLPKTRSDFRL